MTFPKYVSYKVFSFSQIVNDLDSISNGNAMNQVLKIIKEYAIFFEGNIDNPNVGNLKEANFENLQYKKKIIISMKEKLVSNYICAESNPMNDKNSMRNSRKTKIAFNNESEGNRDSMNMSMNNNAFLQKKKINFSEEKMFKHLLFRNSDEMNVQEDFKTIINTFLSFVKILRSIIKSQHSSRSEIIAFDEILILMKIILFYSVDQTAFRAEFYVKKYLNSFKLNYYSLKFYIILKYLDTKFKELFSTGDNNWILLLKYIELHEKYAEILQILKDILQQFDGQSKANKLKLMDIKNEQLGDCYRKIKSFTTELNDKFKIQDQSTFLRYKMASHFLFINKDYDKFTEDQDIQFAEAAAHSNTYFVLEVKNSRFLIQKIPRIYIETTNMESKKLLGEEFQVIFPTSIRKRETIDLRKAIMSTGESTFSTESVIIRKDGYVILVNLVYYFLPIITDKVFIICNLDFKDDSSHSCILVNDYGEITNIGPFFNEYFGIHPGMRAINIMDLFNTKEPLANKFKKHFRKKQKLKSLKEITISIPQYKKIYNSLIILLGVQNKSFDNFSDLLLKESMKQNNERNNNSLSNTTLFSQGSSLLNDFDRIQEKEMITLYFHFRHLFECHNTNYFTFSVAFNRTNSGYQERFSTVFFTHMPESDLMNLNHNILLDMPGNTKSISNTSMTSLDSRTSHDMKKINLKKMENVAKTMSILGIIITLYNAILIALAITLLLVVQSMSANLKNVFSVLKNLRLLNSIYFNEAFHLTNLVRIDNYPGYKTYEDEIKQKNSKIKYDFELVYQKEFRNMAEQFFPQFSLLMSQLNKYIDPDFVNNVLNVEMEVMQLDGSRYKEKLFNAIHYPIITLYILSNLEQYYTDLPFLDISKDIKEQFDGMGDFQKKVYKELLNYPTFRKNFHNTNISMRTYFLTVFAKYKLSIYLIFAAFIFLHVISFSLYIYDANLFYHRILRIAKKAFTIDSKTVDFLLFKISKVKQLINLEEKASLILVQFRKEMDHRKFERSKMEEEKKKLMGIRNGDSLQIGKENNNCNMKKKKYPIKAFSRVIIFIIAINMMYVIYSIIAFPVATDLMKKITSSQDYTISIVEVQRISVNYFLTLKIFMMMNNTKEMGIGDWGLGIGDWAQSPIPNPQSPIPIVFFPWFMLQHTPSRCSLSAF